MHLAGAVFDSALKNTVPGVKRRFLEAARKDLRTWSFPKSIRQKDDARLVDWLRRILRLSALLHDIGHTPFSHTLENASARAVGYTGGVPFHEALCIEILRQRKLALDKQTTRAVMLTLLSQSGDVPDLENTIFFTLGNLINGELDLDRMDFLPKDVALIGLGSPFDLQRLVSSMTVAKQKNVFVIVPHIRAMSSVECFINARHAAYKHLLGHHKVQFYDEVLDRLGARLFKDQNIQNRLHGKTLASLQDAQTELKNDLPECPIYYLTTNGGPPYFEINVGALVDWDGLNYFDDVWVMTNLRTMSIAAGDSLATLRTSFVRRRKDEESLWKDPSEFDDAMSLCPASEIPGCETLPYAQGVETGGKFMRILLGPQTSHPYEEAQRIFLTAAAGRARTALNAKTKHPVGIMIRPFPRNLVGDLSKIKLVDRDGKIKQASAFSHFLSRVDRIYPDMPVSCFAIGNSTCTKKELCQALMSACVDTVKHYTDLTKPTPEQEQVRDWLGVLLKTALS